MFKDRGPTTKGVTYMEREYWKKRGRNRRKSGYNMTENFLQINVRHHTTDPGGSKNTRQDKCQNETKQNKKEIKQNQNTTKS